jgi:hypothetical protein
VTSPCGFPSVNRCGEENNRSPLAAMALVWSIVRDYLTSHPEEVAGIVKDYMIKHPEMVGQMLAEMLRHRTTNPGRAIPRPRTRRLLRWPRHRSPVFFG